MEADQAVKDRAGRVPISWMPTISTWTTVDAFMDHVDFFTIDVADYIGKPADPGSNVEAFIKNNRKLYREPDHRRT